MHELPVDTPQIADRFVSSLLISGLTESRVERVSHLLEPEPADEGSNLQRGRGSWDLEVVLKDQGHVSWTLVQPPTSLCDFRLLSEFIWVSVCPAK